LDIQEQGQGFVTSLLGFECRGLGLVGSLISIREDRG